MQTQLASNTSPQMQYLLRVADTCLILSQRLGEWCGHAPVLEEDIALSNMALDLLGQARALLTHAGQLEGQGRDEDQLAFLRDEHQYLNLTLAELPRGDFAFTVLRNVMLATWLKLLWQQLLASCDPEVAAIAAKAIKEARYHQQHAGDWVLRLAGGTFDSRQRTESALLQLWPYTAELFDADAIDVAAAASALGPNVADLQAPWQAEMKSLFDEASLSIPKTSAFRSSGKRGQHSEHMGFILAEMQHLQRAYPGGVW
ncbi:MAG: 1,2-phenylacetyl-CoA epoxidase subunit PaaC [Burkholderiales bacterium]